MFLSCRYVPSRNKNRSLFDELNSDFFYPTTFSSSFETSSEFVKFENMKMGSESDENKSDESLEKKFMSDEMGFMNNVTNEEHRTLDEAVFDGQSVQYSSVKTKIINGTKEGEKVKTTTLPTTVKKGKYLDLPQESENINASIPNAAEVWALAGMRKFDTKPAENDKINDDEEQLSAGMNNTAKNLLDWTEIAKMSNESDSGDENLNDLSKTTVSNDINGDEDPATSENKESGTLSSLTPSTTMSTILKVLTKTIVDDNRIEQDNGNMEFGGSNKTVGPSSRIDSDAFAKKRLDEGEDSAVELIDPSMKIDSKNKNEKMRVEELEVFTTTESSEGITTDSAEIVEKEITTTESYEATTSIVDSFTVIGENDENEDLFKRTITEVPMVTTPKPVQSTSTAPTTSTAPITSTAPTTSTIQTTTVTNDKHQVETTTNIPSSSVNEIPKSTQRYYKSTKSLRILTTTESPVEFESTVADNEDLSSTLIPKPESSQSVATTHHYEFNMFSSSSPAVEIIDDDKFKYSTLLPETTTIRLRAKSVDLEDSSPKAEESLNKESLDGEPMNNGNLGIISTSVSVAVILIIAGVVYVSYSSRHC